MSGGFDEFSGASSVETWNGSTWVEGMGLGVLRAGHAAVSIKAGELSCI